MAGAGLTVPPEPCVKLCGGPAKFGGQGTSFPFLNFDHHWFLSLKSVTAEGRDYLLLLCFFLWFRGLGNSITFCLTSLSYQRGSENQNILLARSGSNDTDDLHLGVDFNPNVRDISPKYNQSDLSFSKIRWPWYSSLENFHSFTGPYFCFSSLPPSKIKAMQTGHCKQSPMALLPSFLLGTGPDLELMDT